MSPSTLSWFIRERSCDFVLGDMEATGLITVVLYNRWIFLAVVKRLIVYFGVFQFPTCIMESNYMLCILLWSRDPVQNACLNLCCCFFWHNRVAAWISSGQWETAPSAIFADLIQSHFLKVRLSAFFFSFCRRWQLEWWSGACRDAGVARHRDKNRPVGSCGF